jgi:hypothetical protein
MHDPESQRRLRGIDAASLAGHCRSGGEEIEAVGRQALVDQALLHPRYLAKRWPKLRKAF